MIFKKLIYNNNEKLTINFARYKNTINLTNDLTLKRLIQCYYLQETKNFIIAIYETLKSISYIEIHYKRIEDIIIKVPYFEWDLKT